MMRPYVTYHVGGFDPDAPAGNRAEELTDDGDGTGTLTTWDTAGNVTATTPGVALDPAPVEIVSEAERIADLEAALNALAGGE